MTNSAKIKKLENKLANAKSIKSSQKYLVLLLEAKTKEIYELNRKD